MNTVLSIAENILFLSFMGFGHFFVESNRERLGEFTANFLAGISLGLVTVLVSTVPVVLPDGAAVDGRAGPVILAGIVAGPVGAAVAATMGALARIATGGGFVFSGAIVYVVYALIGVALARFNVVTKHNLPTLKSIGVLIVTSGFGAALMFLLIRPFEKAIQWLAQDFPLILAANAMSVTFAALALASALAFIRQSDEVKQAIGTLNLAKRAAGLGIWDFNLKTGKLQWDSRSKELHGVTSESFTGTYDDWKRNVHPDDLASAESAFNDAVINDVPFDTEYRVLLPDGAVRWIKGDAIILRDADRKPTRVVGSNIDYTPIRLAEKEIEEFRAVAAQAQKLETIGQLTGGVAHDFNNLLAVILGNLELLMSRIQASGSVDKDVQKLIEDGIEGARRGAELTQNMLAYARKARLKPVVLNVNDCVRQTQTWMRRAIESRIDISINLETEPWMIRADESSLQSAIVNLLVNSRDAIAESGSIVIETANVVIDDTFADDLGEALPNGRYVMLSVKDDGGGIDEETRKRMFDPFFTTKNVGQGSGLGLSTVLGFVKQSSGGVGVESEPGRGTTIRLYFPVTDEAPSEQEGIDLDARPVASDADRPARILLVEDQAGVQDVLRQILALAGYEVVTANSGDEAFSLYQSDPNFDLLLTDIVMPGECQGPTLAAAIRELTPDLPVIFVTGYSKVADEAGAPLGPNEAFLTKPVSQKVLISTVERLLAGRYT